MALWRIVQPSAKPDESGAIIYTPVDQPLYDDGRGEMPGEDGFTRVDIDAHLGTLKYEPAALADYAGRTGGTFSVAETAAAQQAASDEMNRAQTQIRQLTDPDGFAAEQVRQAAQAQYDALAPMVTDDAQRKALAAALGVTA